MNGIVVLSLVNLNFLWSYSFVIKICVYIINDNFLLFFFIGIEKIGNKKVK